MKHVKRIAPPKGFYAQHGISAAAPPPDSLFWTMFKASQDIAEKALNTGFIQGIKNGNLNPQLYGGYTVMDAYYCLKGADDYKIAAERCEDPKLKLFLDHKYQSYNSYNQQFSQTWGIESANGLRPNQAVLDYANLEHQVVTQDDPVYALVAMLPCEYLWYWLSDQLKGFTDNNLYAFWIEGNLDAKGAYAMGNVIETYRQAHPDGLDPAKALEIYRGAMNGEYQDFEAKSKLPSAG